MISGNAQSGVRISGNSDNNLLQGNIMGLSVAENALQNDTSGVIISDSTANGNVVGGNTSGAGNVLSGNAFNGVLITSGASGNSVAGNRIGTNAAGTNARPNAGNGIQILSASSNTIGGADSSFRNLVSGNLAGGIRIGGAGATNNTISVNYIGSNAAGNDYLQNAAGTDITSNLSYGILIESSNNIIGGSTVSARNLISGQFGNFVPGIRINAGGTGTLVQNNYIGTTTNGNNPLFNGIGIECVAGSFVFDKNLISGSFFGINIGAISLGYVTSNLFGTNAAGTVSGFSIYLNGSSNIKIGEDPEILPPTMNVNDIRRDGEIDLTVRRGILNAIGSGQKIISYVGHGSTAVWRGNVFTKTDAASLTNANRLPVFVTMTCLNGFFHDSLNSGLNEALIKNPSGSAIAVWTSTGAGLPDSYGAFNVEIHRQLLNGATLGQAHLEAKRTIANQDVRQTWVLLGDPSMRLR